MFEGLHRTVLPRGLFILRMARFGLLAVLVDGLALGLGTLGYYVLEDLDWLDAGVNSALVMTGNGPVHPPRTPAGKLFTLLDALLGVMVFAVVVTMLLIPLIHRLMHVFHSRPPDAKEALPGTPGTG